MNKDNVIAKVIKESCQRIDQMSIKSNINMKIYCVVLTIFFFITTFIQAEELEDPHEPVRAKCRDELKLTDDILREGLKNPKDFGCYLFCFLKDIKVMNDLGVFDPEAATQAIRTEIRDIARSDIFSCFDSGQSNKSDDPCESASQMIQCFKDRSAKLYGILGIFQPPLLMAEQEIMKLLSN